MKINRSDPRHLGMLATSAVYSCVAVVARPFIRTKVSNQKIIVFYGHTLNGNLRAFFDYLATKSGYSPYFLALDKSYYKRLKSTQSDPKSILSALSLKDMMVIARSDAFITSHGLHLFTPLRAFSDIKFIDVWHAVSYKGFGSKEFKHLYAHDEEWVSSEDMRELYIKRYGFRPDSVKVTGYARTDQLVNDSLDKRKIIQKYSIPTAKKYILIAPTWKQDAKGRSVLPFNLDEKTFFGSLDKLARDHHAHIIFRTHLNSHYDIDVSHLSNTSFMPYGKYEIVEDFLFISDILVTDWSSTGIDYLPLKRPTVFLDVQAPFKHGFNMGPQHRYGDVVNSLKELEDSLVINLSKPRDFIRRHKDQIKYSTRVAYGNTLDGKSCYRYFVNLKRLLN